MSGALVAPFLFCRARCAPLPCAASGESGPVYAARVLTMNKLITIVPIVPAPTAVLFPPVADSLTSLIP